MKALFLCEEKINDLYDKNIFSKFEVENVVIITTENNLYQEIKMKYPSWNCEYIYIYENREFEKSKEMSEILINEIKNRINNSRIREIADISINSLYEIYTRVIVQVEKSIHELISKYDINEIYLFGGNEKAPYFPLNMAEGERPFRFMYKRRWFLNPVIYNLFEGELKIIWKRELSFRLKIERWLRIFVMNGGKICKSSLKYLRNKKSNVISSEGECIEIVVRTKAQVKSIIPIYRAIEAHTRFKPLLIVYENYANNEVIKTVVENNLEYINARQYASIGSILGCFCEVEFFSREKRRKQIPLYKAINIDSRYFAKELKFQWWDALLFWNSLSAVKERTNVQVKAIINIETYNWVAATQAKWANKEGLPIYSIQFVTLEMCPRIVWTDKYFFMTKTDYKRYEPLVGKDVCGYIGPVCYDDIFNKSQHECGVLNNVLILTQPDWLREDSIRIINDVIQIRKELQGTWKVCVKLHPRENDAEFFYKQYNKYDFVQVILNERDSTDLLVSSDLAIGIISTTLFQAVIIGTPAISVSYDGLVGHSPDVVEYGIVRKLTDYNGIKDYIVNFITEEKNYYLKRNSYLEEILGEYEGKGAVALAEFLNNKV